MARREFGLLLGLVLAAAPIGAQDPGARSKDEPRSRHEFFFEAKSRSARASDALLERLFDAIDANQDGKISKDELAAAVESAKRSREELVLDQLETTFDRDSRRVMPRDTFPVIYDPEMAEATGADMEDDESVIGLVVDGDPRAYPIQIMGRHELVNDTCGRVPIAVSW